MAPLKRFTEARIGLGRFGAGLPTAAHLDFSEAHARARDAVHASCDADAIEATLKAAGREVIRVKSQAADRATYLRRPDLGRKLDAESAQALRDIGNDGGVAIIISEGLSAYAVNTYGAETALAVAEALEPQGIAPIVLAEQGRVALSDPIGEALNVRLAIILIGERPGLSAADSLGAYLTFDPKSGRSDADRNCISNIRKGGISPKDAAAKIAWLATRAFELGLTGTKLKDDAEDLLEGSAPEALPES
ncbi:ethanolamine ammonia-lyase subunit EutC [Methyloligella sp. GL2]|nr:ethanolamine ammonia-lyase subunit EutC [Methyloligella sp. GL2]